MQVGERRVSGPIRVAGLAIEPIAQSDVALSDEDATWVEGNARRMSHIRLERDPRAAKRKKAQYRALHGRLEYERCRFVPTDVYGDADGEACIEVHHKTPLAELRGRRATRLEDLQCVCANCHRVLHRRMRPRLGAPAARWCAVPLGNLLVVAEPQSLECYGSEDILKIVGRLDGGQSGLGLEAETLQGGRLAAIRGVPPIDDQFLGSAQCAIVREQIPFLPLVDLALRRQQVPEVAAWPRGPRKAVVDVEVVGAERFPRPNAPQLSSVV